MKKNCVLLYLFISLLLLCGCSAGQKQEGKQTLILATLFDDPSLFKEVAEFNKKQSAVQIEIKNYMDTSSELEDAVNNIKMEIIAGSGPDLVNFGLYYSPKCASEKILIDLNSLMNQDETFDKNDYFYNIWDTFSDNEQLNILIPSFRISSFATSAPELMNKKDWNMEELVTCYENRPEGTILFPGETKASVFAVLCTGSMDNYVNWSDGTSSFNGESFQRLLEFSNHFPLELVFSEDTSIREEFSEGRALLYPVSISNVFAVSQVTALLGKANYIGYPMDDGNGNIAEVKDIAIGIGKNCKDKQAAWEFLKGLLSEDYQNNITDGLPVKRSSFAKELEAAMQPEYLENGDKSVKEEFLFEGEDSILIYEITKEDADTLISIIEGIRYNSAIDRQLYDIIMEEADFFFHGDRSVEDTADIIQNRSSVFISESM